MVLIVGEVYIDYTRPTETEACKLRLGGVVHAARGLWASGLQYSIAAICPSYLVEQTKNYLIHHGCANFFWIGTVTGAPSVITIGDKREVAEQGYDDLLRDEKVIEFNTINSELKRFTNILFFPGCFNIGLLRSYFCDTASFSFDISYGLEDIAHLKAYIGGIKAIILSTSSALFNAMGAREISPLIAALATLKPEVFLLKENRGGSRLFNLNSGCISNINATLGHTLNSVGVGDVYSAVMVGFEKVGWTEAAWRGARAATYYSQTTYPDDFKRDVTRDQKLSLDVLESIGGVFLPWHTRQLFSIYLAAPDFANAERGKIDQAISALRYHNFNLRRPIVENGELPKNSDLSLMKLTYGKDFLLLHECDLVFAIPLDNDPGTLVEIGIALALKKPVITYDPYHENGNTMVIAGSEVYSHDLDECLNGVFDILSKSLRNRM